MTLRAGRGTAEGSAADLPAAVVFDCDGTIVDTEPVSRAVLREVMPRYGYEVTDVDFAAIVGRPGHVTYAYLSQRAVLPPMDQFRAEVRRAWSGHASTGLAAFDDAVETIRALTRCGVPVAVTSSSSRRHVTQALRTAGVLELVAAHLGADDVTDHKPHPEPYLAAARAVGADPRRCSAVEDTPTGIAAAKASGMFTVAVVRELPRAELAAADRVVDRISLDALVRPRGSARGGVG